jgi:hypothetical protein
MDGVKPASVETHQWFAVLDRFSSEPFMPWTPIRDIFE